MAVELRYWDANAFLAYFQEEAGRVDSCEAVLELAEQGNVLIVTSALTLAEVLALRGKKPLPPKPAMKKKVIDFFKNEYIAVQNVTREIAELSRDLVWDHGIKPKDAIHVAAAIAAGVSMFETYDRPLMNKGNKKVKDIKFREPPPRAQPSLPFPGGLNAPRKVNKIRDDEEDLGPAGPAPPPTDPSKPWKL